MFAFFFDEDASIRTAITSPVNGSESGDYLVEKPTAVTSPVEEVADNASLSTVGDYVVSPSSVASTSNARFLNESFLNRLDEEESEIVYLMCHSVVEDGYENDVIKYIRPYYTENPYMTLFWLYALYTKYRNDRIVFSSILDLLYCLDVKQNDMRFMISLLENGLNSRFSVVQEAAIKVAEKWRTIECLDSLQKAQYASEWIKKYADKVMSEIYNELS